MAGFPTNENEPSRFYYTVNAIWKETGAKDNDEMKSATGRIVFRI